VAESLSLCSRLQAKERVMQTSAECHQYARECIRWAARAKTEEQRKGFLEIALAWREAALLIETPPRAPPLSASPAAYHLASGDKPPVPVVLPPGRA
jgi:hypothetical protein